MEKGTWKQLDRRLEDLLMDYNGLLESLEDVLLEFDGLHMEIGDTADEIRDSIGRAQGRLSRCRLGLKRIRPGTALMGAEKPVWALQASAGRDGGTAPSETITYTEEESPLLPFDI